MADAWISDPAPSSIPYSGRNFIFSFWSLSAQDTVSGQRSAQIQTALVANDSHSGGLWAISATAYYVWDFGHGPGDNALLLDAFDIELGDFIPDDFVDTVPNGTLTAAANNGYIDTSTQIPQGTTLTVTARASLFGKRFAYWLPISALTFSNNPAQPVVISASGAPRDIVVHYNDVVVAFAFFSEVQVQLRPPRQWATYDPWWWIETHGGLVPPGPPPPWWREFGPALQLVEIADRVETPVRTSVLQAAIKQLSLATDRIRRQIRGARTE